MQHEFGIPFHRSTVWRRDRKEELEANQILPANWKPEKSRGRRLCEDGYGKRFIHFTAAVIQMVNETRYCDYAAIYQRRNCPVSETLFESLAESGYPPAMLAVAICKIVPLNFRTRPGAKPVKLTPGDKAIVALKKSGQTVNADSYTSERRKALFKSALRENGLSKCDMLTAINEAERCNYHADWIKEILKANESDVARRARGKAPMSESSKGTPACRVDFHGEEISRRMACYWRKHSKYRACVRFLLTLFESEVPNAPFAGGLTMVDHEINREFQRYMRLRRDQRRATLNKP
jgi:hypothetical protein